MAADAEPLEILLHLPLLCEDKVSSFMIRNFSHLDVQNKNENTSIVFML